MDLQDTADRRRFLIAAGRYSLAALLGGGVAALLARGGSSCLRPYACGECAALSHCALPEAVAARQTGLKGDGDA